LLSQQIAAERTHAEQEQEQLQTIRLQALQAGKLAQETAAQMHGESATILAQVRGDHARNLWLISTLGGVTLITLSAISWFVFRRHRVTAPPALAMVTASPVMETLPTELAPGVMQAVREAVTLEIALQRRELLIAQQTATDEIAVLIERLDQIQAPTQERLRVYEAQVERLEEELLVRTEENRELLKAKVELMRQHLEYERSRTCDSWQIINGGIGN
jgi:hypothetical protein